MNSKNEIQNEVSDKAQKSQSLFSTLFRGRKGDPPWERSALIILLVLTAIAYIGGLGQSGWANSFYSAAVQAGTKSWKAFFFGSIDASNFITVDKPPASLWVMELSARIFGMNSWSMLVPEAIEGVITVWILYMTVRRWFSARAALLSGVIFAMTPVAALMFRFNNPDALLILLLTASAYAFTRALEEGKTKWLVWASVFIGFGFLTKMLAAFFIIPVFVIVYLFFAPVSVRRRLVQIIISAVSVVVSAGWWVAIVQLVPAANRPYIGSSQKNSILDLIFGYNGLGRLTGNESGSGQKGGMGAPSGEMASHAANIGSQSGDITSHAMGGPGGGGNFGGTTGLTRLFNSQMGGQISWLIPAALILLVVAVWLVRRNWKSDRTVPAMLLWGGTFIVTGIVFSFGQGTIHPYYTIALAPAIGAIIGIGAEVLWKRQEQLVARIGLAAAIAATAAWAFVLLDRTPAWNPWLRIVVVVLGGLAAIAIIFGQRLGKKVMIGVAAAALAASLAGPFAFTIQTIATPHTGSMPTAGPTTTGEGFPGRFGGGQMPPGANSSNTPMGNSGNSSFGGFNGNNSGNNATSASNRINSSNAGPGATNWSNPGNSSIGGFNGNNSRNFNQGGPGGSNETPGSAIVNLLKQNASKYTWVAATVGSQSSAPYQLATGEPIMDIGGFTGSDPTPTLSQFKKYVSEGKIHYFINSGRGFDRMGGNTSKSRSNRETTNSDSKNSFQNGPMGGSSNSEIINWIQNNFKSVTVDGVTLYDLTQAK
ncbi:glycosyltransferase family 39 protein [Bacillus sp. BRMEA1]|uniref:ArnT family glycosyltransferase n=1 Tax=Neobacillus endophyticus TaxID=2738405 RepID=UPI001564130B|nr:glycosyltransferase family 39 protein [Neobacillus endophyticus]NRD80021.1 glycosyltransferase family 39 protein [Neobacillus endophyticus]